MPTLTRWFLRAAMIQLVAALLLGLLMVLRIPALERYTAVSLPVYVHLLVLGWATQMIFGVAYWMFPRPAPDHGYGHPAFGWTCFIALNAGLALRAWAEPAVSSHPSAMASSGLLVAALLQLLAAVLFVVITWRRVAAR